LTRIKTLPGDLPRTRNEAETGNDDRSGEPAGNRGEEEGRPSSDREFAGGDRGAESGRHQEQLRKVRGKPGAV